VTMPVPIVIVAADGSRTPILAAVGVSLMRAATGAGIEGIAADCGGVLSCATCHVYVDAHWAARLAPVTADEDAMLEMTASERRPASRLSCQIMLDDTLGGLTVHLPPTQY
jgi:ferredoxin, 2Fe-2S